MRPSLQSVRWVSAAFIFVVFSLPAAAQQKPEQKPVPFADFNPGRCAVSPMLINWLTTRDDPDTSAYAPRKDTLMRTTTDSARICDDVYHGLTDNERELLNLARVKLAIGNDAAAGAARAKYLATLASRPPREQGWAYFLIALDDMTAKRPRFASAKAALAVLDALPSVSVWKASVLAHAAVATGAKAAWDEPLAKAEASIAIATYQRLTPDQKTRVAMPAARMFMLKAEQEMRLASIAGAQAVLDSAKTMIPSNSGRAYQLVMESVRLYSILGKEAKPIDAQFWFRASSNEPRPAKGKVTFVSAAAHACVTCSARYRAIGRLIGTYGSRGLEMVNMTQTLGFYADTAPALPVVEARYDSLYFLGRRKLPGILAVHETRYGWRPDGRRRNEPSPQDTNYPYATVILVDAKGIIRYVALDWDPILEVPIGKFIEALLAERAAQP